MLQSEIQMTVLGVNFRKSSIDIRNKFALAADTLRQVYEDKNRWPEDFFILSTCNRTEIYTTAFTANRLMELFGRYCPVTGAEIAEYTFVKRGNEAVRHLLRVASGLDSQILGDYEIVGQLKNAFNLAKANGKVGGMMEKLMNFALKTSKEVRGNTFISDGTTSTSYAVVQLLRQQAGYHSSMRICLLGLGKIGSLTLKNLAHYLPGHEICIMNRTGSKAVEMAHKYGVKQAPAEQQDAVLAKSEVLILATGADHAIVSRKDLEGSPVKLIFDLTVPSNLGNDVKEMEGMTIYDIDQLSAIVNETLQKRRHQLPIAESIVDSNMNEIVTWQLRRFEYLNKASVASLVTARTND